VPWLHRRRGRRPARGGIRGDRAGLSDRSWTQPCVSRT
jgi:hypothetical protein